MCRLVAGLPFLFTSRQLQEQRVSGSPRTRGGNWPCLTESARSSDQSCGVQGGVMVSAPRRPSKLITLRRSSSSEDTRLPFVSQDRDLTKWWQPASIGPCRASSCPACPAWYNSACILTCILRPRSFYEDVYVAARERESSHFVYILLHIGEKQQHSDGNNLHSQLLGWAINEEYCDRTHGI